MGLDDTDYARQAHANPMVWDRRSSSHARCADCIEKNGVLWHAIPDTSAEGKEKQKKEATDMRYGTALVDACSEGTAAWLTKVKSDQGKGSKIASRLDVEYAEAAIYTWDKYQKKLMSIKLVPDMRRVQTLMRWRNDIMSVYQEMVELADANQAKLKPLLQNEHLMVTLIRDNAPQRQKDAAHWRTTRNETTLKAFFKAMIEFDQTDDSPEDDEVANGQDGTVMATMVSQYRTEGGGSHGDGVGDDGSRRRRSSSTTSRKSRRQRRQERPDPWEKRDVPRRQESAAVLDEGLQFQRSPKT